jgi:hypothetical protein
MKLTKTTKSTKSTVKAGGLAASNHNASAVRSGK